MTKSQNTKNEQLTEQWKKGELPTGYYYVKNEFNNIFPSDYSESYDCINDAVIKDFFTEVSEIKEVLEPVPSYEEWKAKLEQNAHLKELIRKAKGIITSYRLTGNQSTYSNNDMKECVAQINEALR